VAIPWTEVWEITWRSLRVAGAATFLAALLGLPLGVWLGARPRRGGCGAQVVLYAAMGLPPVVVGLVFYVLLSRSGPLGGSGLLFTQTAMVLAEAVLAFPMVAGFTMAGVRARAEGVRRLVRGLGGSERQVLTTLLWESRRPIVAALAAGFGSAISEVGAATIVGGDIRHHTRVLTTAVVLETRKGELQSALALGAVLLGVTLVVTAILVVWGEKR